MVTSLDKEVMTAAFNAIKELCPEPITYRRIIKGHYDPDIGKTVTPALVEMPVYAFIKAYGEQFVNGTVIEMGDMQASIPALQLDFEPSLGDELLIDGKTWVVKGKPQVRGTSTVIMWKLQVRCGQ